LLHASLNQDGESKLEITRLIMESRDEPILNLCVVSDMAAIVLDCIGGVAGLDPRDLLRGYTEAIGRGEWRATWGEPIDYANTFLNGTHGPPHALESLFRLWP
jgi:hypothetical protein